MRRIFFEKFYKEMISWRYSIRTSQILKSRALADSIINRGSYVTITADAGKDTVGNYGGSHVSINTGTGNDSTGNWGENNTIAHGGGNDYINNDWAHGTVYIYGSGNDTVSGFRSQNNFIVIENYTW